MGSSSASTISKTSTIDPATAPWSVTSVDPASGVVLWGIPATKEFGVFSGMVIDRGVVHGHWAGSAGCARNFNDRTTPFEGVAAIDAATGALRWRTSPLVAGDMVINQVASSVANGVFVVSNNDSGGGAAPLTVLVGVDARTGATRWRLETPLQFGFNFAGPVLIGYEPQAGGLALQGIDRTTGKSLWRVTVSHRGVPDVFAVTGNRFVLGLVDGDLANPWLGGFDARTGHQLWSVANQPVRLARFADSGVVANSAGGVVGLDANTGRQRWRRDNLQDLGNTGDRQNMAAGRLALRSQDLGVDILDMPTGKTLWHSAPGSDIVATRADGIVLEGATTNSTVGKVEVFAPSDGRLIGQMPKLPPQQLQQVGIGSPLEVGPNGHVYVGRTYPGRN